MYIYTHMYRFISASTHTCVCVDMIFLKHLKVNLEIFVSKYFSMFYLKKKNIHITTVPSSKSEN